METKAQNTKYFIIAILLLSFIIWIVYYSISKLWGVFASANPTLGAATITASVTIIVSIFSIVISKQFERKAVVFNHLREKKIPVYEKIIEFIFRFIYADKLGKEQPTEHETAEFVSSTIPELIIWGSDEMVAAFYSFRAASFDTQEGRPSATIDAVANLLLVIRKDLGHSNNNLNQNKILGLFINEYAMRVTTPSSPD